jgi:hypothetical protein
VSPKFVLYKRTGENSPPLYFIRTQLEFGEILNRESERKICYEREMLAESDDRELLRKMKRLAEGEEE